MEMVPRSRRKLLPDRERNLCKKAKELSILCGTDVCMIILKPHKTEPETWPQERCEVHRIIEKYKAMLVMKNNDVKVISTSSVVTRDATDATNSISVSSHNPNKKRKLDFNVSDCFDSKTRGKKLLADYNTMSSEGAINMEMQYQDGIPENEFIGDDEAMLASLEAKLQAITNIIASGEANYFEFL